MIKAPGLKVLQRLDFFEKISSSGESVFKEIRSKLSRNQYKSADEFMAEVKAIIETVKQSNSDMFYQLFGDHVLSVFEKACRKHFLFTPQTWTDTVCKHREKVLRVMANGPGQISQYTEELAKKLVSQSKQPEITERELRNFIKASELLTQPDDHLELLKIVRDCSNDTERKHLPDLTATNIHIDLTILKPTTIRRLQHFVRTTLESRGIAYPQ